MLSRCLTWGSSPCTGAAKAWHPLRWLILFQLLNSGVPSCKLVDLADAEVAVDAFRKPASQIPDAVVQEKEGESLWFGRDYNFRVPAASAPVRDSKHSARRGQGGE